MSIILMHTMQDITNRITYLHGCFTASRIMVGCSQGDVTRKRQNPALLGFRRLHKNVPA